MNKETSAKNSASFLRSRRGTIKRLLGYLLRCKWMTAAALILMLASNLLALLGPKISGSAIDAIAPGNTDFDKVFLYCGLMALFYVLSAALSYLLSVLMIKLSQKIVRSMRREVMQRLLTLPVGYFDSHPAGDIISRISYDIDTVNTSLSGDLLSIFASLITVTGSFIMMITISPVMMLIFAVTLPASILFTWYKTKRIQPYFRKRSGKLGELNGYAEEMLSGHTVIKAGSREDFVCSSFNRRNEDAVSAYYDADYHGCIVGPSVNFINNLSLALISTMGGFIFLSGGISLGDLSAFVLYSRRFAGPINEMAGVLTELQSAVAAAERVFRLLDEAPETPDIPGALNLKGIRGEISFDRVSFSYTPDIVTLRDITMSVSPGQTLAIVGPTGAGKTTLINLLMRFYDADSGTISVDGLPSLQASRKSLRKGFSMVLQDTWLFDGTVRENIAYGSSGVTDEQIKQAAKTARIHDYIMSLENGYDTLLSDEGSGISKGQQQLLTIARAMLSDASVLILDEATSNVDSRTEAMLQQAMQSLMKNKTCIVIAHRLSTVKNADCVIVLREGQILQRGTHEQLLASPGFYRDLYYAQFS